ncbi:MAG: bifunctional nuclease family protein [Chitinophagaceae bacterium]|uniref:bifunctional nuclease family protein n=1 Tax=unclassified Paraflavitalea TaxID=2798305 RepID=UPI003D35697E|nr:bifunctional nuclease family protein [Chitinophagaceae bacterium]
MEKREIQILALSTSESSPGNFSLVLEDLIDKKRFVIIIGTFEAQAIAIYLERMQLPRPLTHDLFKTTITQLGATLKEVVIHNIVDEIFQAWLVLTDFENKEKKVDARASDALALAIRFDCPVFIYEPLLHKAAISEEFEKFSFLRGSVSEYTLEELQSLLNDLLAKEDYESASKIRDLIQRRK